MSSRISEVISQNILDTSSQSTKVLILSAYLKIAVEKGATELSLTKLAEEASLSKQLVRYHYNDIDEAALELFQIVARMGARYSQEHLDKVKTWNEKLQVWAQVTFDWALAYPDFALILLFMYHRASVDKRVSKLHCDILHIGRERITKLLEESPKKNISKNAKSLALVIHRQLIASIIEMLSKNDFKNQVQYKKEYWDFLKAYIL